MRATVTALPWRYTTQEVRDNMKKNLLLLLLASALLAGCESEFSFTPRKGGKYVPFEEQQDEEEAAEDDSITCTYNFFFSYSHTTKYDEVLKKDVSCPIFTLRDVAMFSPLGACPQELDTKEELVALATSKGFPVETFDTETFDTFIGFSFNTVCLDEDGLWNFATDTKQQAIINLYGIWVSN